MATWRGLRSPRKILELYLHYLTDFFPRFPESIKIYSTVAVDEITAKLFRINEAVLETGIRQKTSLGLLRCDYLLDSSHGDNLTVIKQVEVTGCRSEPNAQVHFVRAGPQGSRQKRSFQRFGYRDGFRPGFRMENL